VNQKKAFIVEREQSRAAEPLNVLGDIIHVKLSGSDTDRTYAMMEDTTGPQAGPPLHRHSREDESFYVLEGHYRFEVDDQEIKAGPGAFVHAPRGTAHTFQNIGQAPGRLLVTVQPAGLEVFFAELAAATAGMKEPDLKVIVPIFEKHGLELLGPPLAARGAPAAAQP
jgi:quercetin dioxygenase-like cupin family protein